jgi:uncharacterized protein YeeX (DUF496 family)
MINYNDFSNLLKEGLIKTHNIRTNYDKLEHQLNFNGIDAYVHVLTDYTYDVEIRNPDWLKDLKTCEYFININGNYGYFPNRYRCYKNGKENRFKFEKNENTSDLNLDIFLSNIKNCSKIIVIFEAKFESGLYKKNKNVPDILFHLSPSKNKEKILKNGLVPKSNNKISYHKDRIYLFQNINDYEKLLISFKNVDNYNLIDEVKYDLYEVKLDKERIILHNDPYFEDGFYTYDNISPKDLMIIKNDL